jgi:hypothetical protein
MGSTVDKIRKLGPDILAGEKRGGKEREKIQTSKILFPSKVLCTVTKISCPAGREGETSYTTGGNIK